MKRLWIIGALVALLAVAAGALGAHALKSRLDADMLDSFQTAVRFQFYHALALLLLGLADGRLPAWSYRWAGWLFIAGIILFCGSIYTFTIRELTGVDISGGLAGPITPLGGLSLMAGWAVILTGATKIKTIDRNEF